MGPAGLSPPDLVAVIFAGALPPSPPPPRGPRASRRPGQPEAPAEAMRAGAAAAVLHAGHHEQPEELLHFPERLAPRVAPPGRERHHALVVVDAAPRADRRIVRPVVK